VEPAPLLRKDEENKAKDKQRHADLDFAKNNLPAIPLQDQSRAGNVGKQRRVTKIERENRVKAK